MFSHSCYLMLITVSKAELACQMHLLGLIHLHYNLQILVSPSAVSQGRQPSNQQTEIYLGYGSKKTMPQEIQTLVERQDNNQMVFMVSHGNIVLQEVAWNLDTQQIFPNIPLLTENQHNKLPTGPNFAFLFCLVYWGY